MSSLATARYRNKVSLVIDDVKVDKNFGCSLSWSKASKHFESHSNLSVFLRVLKKDNPR